IRRPPRPELGETAPSYVLVDFGSVRQRLEPRGGSTVVGTFGYMAPEQLQGRALPATDVYAVGATALRLLTGVEPEDLPHQGLRVAVRRALGNRDPDLAAVLEKMLEPDPDRRAARIAPLLATLSKQDETDEPSGNRGKRDRGKRGARERRRERERDRRRERKERRAERRERATRDRSSGDWDPPPLVAALFVPAVIIGLAV